MICDTASDRSFNPDSVTDLQRVVEEFLGDYFVIQINRDRANLFHWRVIVSVQNVAAPGACFGQAKGVGELGEAMLDACIAAKAMDKREA